MLIGLGHQAQVGKDTVADIFERRFGFKRAAFADSLKEACQVVFGLTRQQVYGPEKMEIDPFWGRTPRSILQLAGTEGFRAVFGPDIWVKSFERRNRELFEGDLIVTDVRFESEVEAIRRWGGYLVKVTRPAVERGDIKGEKKHGSELGLEGFDGWDLVIQNTGTLEELEEKVAEAKRQLQERGE